MVPFFGAMVAALMVITYVPSVSLWLPVKTNRLKAEEVEKSFFMRGNSEIGLDSAEADAD